MISAKFKEVAEQRPNKVAIICGEQRLTYFELLEEVRQLAGWLREDFRVKNGQRIVVVARNDPRYVALLFAAADCGAVVAPLSASLPPRARQHLYDQLDAFLVLDERATLRARNSAASHALGCEDFGQEPFLMLQTSGTTGEPKPLVFTQACKVNRARQMQYLYNVTEQDVTLVATPLHLSLGLRLCLMPLLTGGTLVMLPAYTPEAWAEAVKRYRVTFTASVPAQLRAISSLDPHYFTSLRCVVSTSAPYPLEDQRKLLRTMPLTCKVHECYGTAEVAIATSGFMDVAYWDVATIEIDGTGEIAVNSPELIALNAGVDERGFFHTGDLGRWTNDGHLVLMGRKKEVINVGGVTVFPQDVEAVLSKIPNVVECGAFAMPDPLNLLGERLGAAIVWKSAPYVLDYSRIIEKCLPFLSPEQLPIRCFSVQSLPKTELGKLKRRALAEMFTKKEV